MCVSHALVASLFDFELSIPSNFLFFSFSFNLVQSLLLFFHYLEDSSNTPYSAKKEMELLTSPTSTQKTSRPYEKDIQLGRCPTHLQRWSATWRAKDVPNPSSTRPFERRHFSPQPKYQVNSAYIHDTRNGQQQAVKKGQSGWVLQAVIPPASF